MNGVGRVFFRYDDEGKLVMVAFQPLENHRVNVEKLLFAWKEGLEDEDWTLNTQTKSYLQEAIKNHDWGKLSTFNIKQKDKQLTYSFAGHRFKLHPEIRSSYAKLIERGHHDFSTQELVSATHQLVHKEGFQLQDRQRFAKDLYIYEMCDQIEAELTNLIWEGESENRAFMSFALEATRKTQHEVLRIGDSSSFKLYPFSLRDAIELELEFQCFTCNSESVNDDLVKKVQELYKQTPESIQKIRINIVPELVEQAVSPSNQDVKDFYRKSTGFTPNMMQQEAWQAITQNEDDALLLKAPTGSGKTEAATLPLLA